MKTISSVKVTRKHDDDDDDDDDDDTNGSQVTISVDDVIGCDVTLVTSSAVLDDVIGNTLVVSVSDVTVREDDGLSDDVIETCDDVTVVCVPTGAVETVPDISYTAARQRCQRKTT